MAVQFIRKHIANAHISWFCDTRFEQIARLLAGVDEVVALPLKDKKFLKSFEILRQKQGQFDIIIDLQGLLKSALVSRILGKNIFGFDRFSTKEGLASIFYTHKYSCNYNKNIILRNLELCAFALNFSFDEKEILAKEPCFLKNSKIPNENSKIPSENSQPKYTPLTPHKTILALGSELKNTFGIYYKGNIFLSPYIGDLKNIATKERFDALLATFKRTYELEFTEIIADLHPHFSHTKDFEKSGQNIKKLAHHKAHIYSVMCENNLPLNADIIGFAFDGTGYGEDFKIWGGEVFGTCESKGLKRLYHFDNFAMIGSQNAIKNIYFLAFALLRKYELSAPSFFGRFNQNQLKRLEIGLKAASVQTSSLGRIFDAVASIVLGLDSVSYDAQAPMELEALYDSSLDVCYEFSVSGEIISLEAVLKSILAESLPSVAATGFINGIAALIAKIAKKHEKSVVLGGGCFANKALLERTITLLEAQNTPYYLPKNLPAGDESIALGQLYYALKDENE